MMKYFFRGVAAVAVMACMNAAAMAQESAKTTTTNDNEEIIIMKKGDKDTKLTVEIKNGEVTVNGRPMSEFKDDNVVISKRKAGTVTVRGFAAPRSPFRGGVNNVDVFRLLDSVRRDNSRVGVMAMNRAVLGVTFANDDKGAKIDGAKIRSIIKGSAAEKAGLKENDIITKIDDVVIASPEDVTKAISKFKPEDKTVITYKRDKKEQKANVSLGKRDGAIALNGNRDEIFRNFDYNFNSPGMEGFNFARGGSPRLGIKAQDTEEGKGVKVLDVDDGSTAEKAGVKEGDIITEFDGKAVNSATELADAAREAKDKNLMKVKLNRDGKSQELEIKIPKKLKTANL